MTRKYFGTDGIRGRVGESTIHPEFVLKLGYAVGRVLSNGERKKVLIGKDTRVSGYMLESALEAGLSAAGVDIHLLGPMPTPAISYLTRTFRASAGIVISASHNPFYDNGIKFFAGDGAKLDDASELAIEAQLAKPMEVVSSERLGKAHRVDDAPGRYIEFCKSCIPPKVRLNGLKIVLDCANGATYHIAPSVFSELGAEVILLSTEPDGFNINASCGSTQPQNLQAKVLAAKADLGIAFDGDGDRLAMVDATGKLLDGDDILYIIAKSHLRHHRAIGGVVGTVMSNLGLEQALTGLGLDFFRTQVGDRYVIEALRQRQWRLGGETSGHIICLDKNGTGDGIVAALQVLAAMIEKDASLATLCTGMTKLPQKQHAISTPEAKKLMADSAICATLAEVESALGKQGRVLLRPSGTEPVLRVMVEAQSWELVDKYTQILVNAIELSANKNASVIG